MSAFGSMTVNQPPGDAAPAAKAAPVPVFSGVAKVERFTVKEPDGKRGGFLLHDFVVQDDGYNHYRLVNGPADAPWYGSLADVKAYTIGTCGDGAAEFEETSA
jgi:hypothetical protein